MSTNSGVSGVGLGLRFPHIEHILASRPAVPWFEVIADNFFVRGTKARNQLAEICKYYPITLHSVGLSLGSIDEPDWDYLRGLKEIIDEFKPAQVSEHLAWTSVHGHHFHDLLPLPYTEETVAHVSKKLKIVQDFIGQRLLIENVSCYLNFKDSEFNEWEFVRQVAEASDSHILFDVNNVFVNSVNLGVDAQRYVAHLPVDRVRQFHLGGFEERSDHLLDSHSRPVAEQVWDLYRDALMRFGPQPTCIEWDNDIPDFETLMLEQKRATALQQQCCSSSKYGVAC